jgi:hypothetical protein
MIGQERKGLKMFSPMEKIWMGLGLQGALEMMDASCSLCERLTEECVENPSVKDALIQSIAAEIISGRQLITS